MCRLSVNVNKLATLRNSRGKNLPDVAAAAQRILEYGAHGITVHPRPDGRHIRWPDVYAIHEVVCDWNRSAKTPVEFNIEGYPSNEMLDLLDEIKPDQATFVPDPPEALTSNAGWDLNANESLLVKILARQKASGIRASLFVDPKNLHGAQTAALLRLKPGRIELYTESFADHFGGPEQEQVTETYVQAARTVRYAGIGVNAGHDLNQSNLAYLLRKIPWIEEVSIGHALICEALEQGMRSTIASYLKLLP